MLKTWKNPILQDLYTDSIRYSNKILVVSVISTRYKKNNIFFFHYLDTDMYTVQRRSLYWNLIRTEMHLYAETTLLPSIRRKYSMREFVTCFSP